MVLKYRMRDVPAEGHGSCIQLNKHPVQDDEYNYHGSPQAHLTEGIIATGNNFDANIPKRVQ